MDELRAALRERATANMPEALTLLADAAEKLCDDVERAGHRWSNYYRTRALIHAVRTNIMPHVQEPEDEREDEREIVAYACRGFDETGAVYVPAKGEPDWVGKRPYDSVNGQTVFLFDDELMADGHALGRADRLAELHERRLEADNGDGEPLTILEVQDLNRLERGQ